MEACAQCSANAGGQGSSIPTAHVGVNLVSDGLIGYADRINVEAIQVTVTVADDVGRFVGHAADWGGERPAGEQQDDDGHVHPRAARAQQPGRGGAQMGHARTARRTDPTMWSMSASLRPAASRQ